MSTDVSSQPVSFFTQTQYPLPSQKFMIPTSWKRYQLSQLINKTLLLEKPVPFDFLVRGEILRTTLGAWCADNGVGEEETLEIEYIESVMPPQRMSDIPHDDWVSTVLCQPPRHIITSSYDGNIRMFDYSKALVSSTLAHNAPISSICVVSEEDASYTIASASHDLTGQITKITLLPNGSSSSKVLASLHLHTAPLSSIASNGTWILTSSWDGLVGFWDTTLPASDEIPEPVIDDRDRKKRRRVDDSSRPKRKAPLNVFKSHTSRVSQCVFSPSESRKAYSCGHDSTVRKWDTEYGICEHTFNSSEKPFVALALTSEGNTVLATSTDRTLNVFDLRSSSTSLNSSVKFMHPSTPSCLAVGENSLQVATGAYDGVIRVWDLRSPKGPMSAFKVWDGSKVLSVDWQRSLVCVGGEGGLEMWKVGEDKT